MLQWYMCKHHVINISGFWSWYQRMWYQLGRLLYHPCTPIDTRVEPRHLHNVGVFLVNVGHGWFIWMELQSFEKDGFCSHQLWYWIFTCSSCEIDTNTYTIQWKCIKQADLHYKSKEWDCVSTSIIRQIMFVIFWYLQLVSFIIFNWLCFLTLSKAYVLASSSYHDSWEHAWHKVICIEINLLHAFLSWNFTNWVATGISCNSEKLLLLATANFATNLL